MQKWQISEMISAEIIWKYVGGANFAKEKHICYEKDTIFIAVIPDRRVVL